MADDIRHDVALFEDAVLFVMPGGADLPFCEALNGGLIRRIRQFVEEGGSTLDLRGRVLGLPGDRVPRRDRGGDLRRRELGFVDAVAVGSLKSSPAASLRRHAKKRCGRHDPDDRSPDRRPVTLYAHYHGDCRFDLGTATSHAAQFFQRTRT